MDMDVHKIVLIGRQMPKSPIHEPYPTREPAVPTKYPRGGAPQKEGSQRKPGSPAGAESHKHTHTGALHYCACPTPPPFSF